MRKYILLLLILGLTVVLAGCTTLLSLKKDCEADIDCFKQTILNNCEEAKMEFANPFWSETGETTKTGDGNCRLDTVAYNSKGKITSKTSCEFYLPLTTDFTTPKNATIDELVIIMSPSALCKYADVQIQPS